MNGLFGVELPTPVNFIVAFIVVLALIGAATWAVKRFGGARLEAAARGRQPRLAVIDSAAVDGRRKLVIIRRDNVEHLLMVGGASDIVVETNIVRTTPGTTREAPARTPALDTLQRALPLPDPTPWPLAPEPAVAPAPVVRDRPRPAEEPQWPAAPEPHAAPAPQAPAARPAQRAAQADTLAGLANDLAQKPAPAARASEPARAPAPTPAPVAHSEPQIAAGDQNLAEMAHRLEAALRRPGAQPAQAAKPAQEAPPVRIEPRIEQPKPAAKPAPRAEAPRPNPAAQAAAPEKPVQNLEQEMANLLGRPSTGKT